MLGPRIVPANVPPGYSSATHVNRLKKIFGGRLKKVGHFGSLDPFAEGLLLIGFNGAMKWNGYIQRNYRKTYRAQGLLGLKTPTGDLTCPREEWESTPLDPEIKSIDARKCESLFRQRFPSPYHQSPHPYSASKHKGRPLYAWAREGVIIRKPPVERKVEDLFVLEKEGPRITFRVTVSSGTYIRTLFEDLASLLSSPGVLTHLCRERIGPFSLGDAVSLDNLSPSNLERYAVDPRTPDFLERVPFQ